MNLAYEFDWSVLWRDPYGVMLIKGLGMTIFLGATAWIIAMVMGILVGTLRITKYKTLRFAGTLYVEVFRNIPLLVQMFFGFMQAPCCLAKPCPGRSIVLTALPFMFPL